MTHIERSSKTEHGPYLPPTQANVVLPPLLTKTEGRGKQETTFIFSILLSQFSINNCATWNFSNLHRLVDLRREITRQIASHAARRSPTSLQQVKLPPASWGELHFLKLPAA
jgi:hypothetical protein